MALKKIAPLAISEGILAQVSAGSYYAPHSVLGAHLVGDDYATVRTLRHLATAVVVVTSAGEFPMEHELGGIWVAVLPVASSAPTIRTATCPPSANWICTSWPRVGTRRCGPY